MPNWCSNTLAITGPAADVDRLVARLATPYTDLAGTIVSGPLLLMNMAKPWTTSEEKADYAENWYEAHIAHWGTKWDVEAEVHDTDEPGYEPQEPGTRTVSYTFSSAWAPPERAVATCSADWPTLTFRLEFDECGNDYAGRRTYRAGTLERSDDGPSRTYFCSVCDEHTYCPWDQPIACQFADPRADEDAPAMTRLLHTLADDSPDSSSPQSGSPDARFLSDLIADYLREVAGRPRGSLEYDCAALGDAIAARYAGLPASDRRALIALLADEPPLPDPLAHALLAGIAADDAAALRDDPDPRIARIALHGSVGYALGRD